MCLYVFQMYDYFLTDFGPSPGSADDLDSSFIKKGSFGGSTSINC